MCNDPTHADLASALTLLRQELHTMTERLQATAKTSATQGCVTDVATWSWILAAAPSVSQSMAPRFVQTVDWKARATAAEQALQDEREKHDEEAYNDMREAKEAAEAKLAACAVLSRYVEVDGKFYQTDGTLLGEKWVKWSDLLALLEGKTEHDQKEHTVSRGDRP